VRAPQGLAPLPAGSVTTPEGFHASGAACGLKPSGLLDVGLLVSLGPAV
jgi:glutamate N-acetyltransferase / amino-acid N-acetyltransferase